MLCYVKAKREVLYASSVLTLLITAPPSQPSHLELCFLAAAYTVTAARKVAAHKLY